MSRLLKTIVLTVILSCCILAAIFFYITPDYSAPPPPPTEAQLKNTYQAIASKSCDTYTRGTNDGPEALALLVKDIQARGFNENNYMDVIINKWNGKGGDQKKCFFDDGQPFTSVIWSGYSRLLRVGANQDRWITNLNKIETLHTKYPESSFIALLKAEYWKSYAWDARGSGFASTVTDEGNKLFNKRMQKAEKVLLESKAYASEFALWSSMMIEVQHILNRSPKEIDKTFIDGVNKDKSYTKLYFTMLRFNVPKWGGTWGTVENLVNWSVKHTQDTEGDAMYARMYWVVYEGLLKGTQLFEDTYATWPKMKKGFEDMMERYPKSRWNLNNFAKFSCLANDKETFHLLREKIGSNIHQDAWSGSLNLDLCEHKMGYINE